MYTFYCFLHLGPILRTYPCKIQTSKNLSAVSSYSLYKPWNQAVRLAARPHLTSYKSARQWWTERWKLKRYMMMRDREYAT